jgi:Protein of unknown function (DUF2868)
MLEHSALEVIAVRAIENQDGQGAVWTDAERAWASRTAAEAVGEKADAESFVAKRASLLLERLGDHKQMLLAPVRGMHWQPWYGWAAVIAAGILGIVIDRIGASHRVDLLAPPILALIGWNLVAYLTLLATQIRHPSTPSVPGLLRRLTMRIVRFTPASGLLTSKTAFASGDAVTIASLANLTSTWFVLAKPLYGARVGCILHSTAAALALGVILGFYFRGLVSEYKATWESTFLDATVVHGMLAVILAPGAWLTGIAVPNAAHIQSIRAPSGENAAVWLHLYAASVFLIVLVPRLGLALHAWKKERRLSRNFPISLDERYFRVLLRGFHAKVERVRVVPFSYTLPEAARSGLEAILARSFGGSASLVFEPPMRWEGDESDVSRISREGKEPVIAVFNLTATPEDDVHGAFVETLKKHLATGRGGLIAVLDGSTFEAHWPGDDIRLEKRRRTWSDLFTSHRLPMIYVNLSNPDLKAADSAIHEALVSMEAHNRAIS